jgi:acetoin utilization protein AcuB
MKVFEPMTRDVLTVKPSTPLKEAYKMMRDERIRHLPVLENKKLVGLLSDRDILREGYVEDDSFICPDVSVGELMVEDLITCLPSTSVSDAVELLIENKIDCLPVSQFGKFLGIVTSTDIMALMIKDKSAWIYQPIPITFNLKPNLATEY